MFAILKREVKAYFQTVTGWLFIAANDKIKEMIVYDGDES